MPTYKGPLDDFNFDLYEVLGLEKYANLPAFSDATPDLVKAILEEGAKIATEVMLPLNQTGDAEGCHFEKGEVTTPKGFKEAYQTYCEAGWGGLTGPKEYGGQGLPRTLGTALGEMWISANWGFSMYPGLTNGAVYAITVNGSEEQKQRFLPNMLSGVWSGTMNLTEPHCGTDLGLMRSKAEPQEDGSYQITGTKIFISAGEHDLAENIIHLVLAKIPGGPDGIKGVSLFIVPRNHINEDGSVGENNGVTCGSIEEKMGIHSNSTCVMNYEKATGYLIGEEHKGMRAMFVMMNEARLAVALQGVAIAEIAYQNAADYARERLQGRALTGPKFPDKAADPIIVHPDVRRMLMHCRAFTEGARALTLFVALQSDIAEGHPDEAAREKAGDLLGLLTPVIKTWFSDMGFECAVTAQQVLGGHGYIREYGMEQYVRDARIAQIYEGANGIQALDLVGRKLPANGGRAARTFLAMVQEFIEANKENEEMASYIGPLALGLERLQEATMWLMQHGTQNPDNAGAASMDYLYILALVSTGYMWAQSAKVAKDNLANSAGNAAFYEAKCVTAKYFFDRLMPDTIAHLEKIKSGAESIMALKSDDF